MVIEEKVHPLKALKINKVILISTYNILIGAYMDFDITQQRDVNRVFSFYNVLKIISNLDKYREWVKSYHQIEDDSFLVDGYKFFTEVVISNLLDAFHECSAFDFEDDMAYYRANSVGVYIHDIPNTSEKTIFVKNLWNRLKSINEQSSWDDIANYWTNAQDVFTLFDSIFLEDVIPGKIPNKNLALKIVTILDIHIHFNDLSRGVPFAYPMPLLETDFSDERLNKSFNGYSFCLQYLWYVLLGREKFESTCLKRLHQSTELYTQEAIEELKNESHLFDDLIERFSVINEREPSDISVSPTQVKWKCLDRFFESINEEIVGPLENEYNIQPFDAMLLLKESFNKNKLSLLLRRDTVSTPEYLLDNSTPELKVRMLDSYFYWEMIYKLDCHQVIRDGISAFNALLMGAIQSKNLHKTNERVEVLRIKHPVKYTNGHAYSYAVLIENYGLFSDFSVWYVFFNCATDYSGYGGTLHQRAEVVIEHYAKQDAINIQEFVIDKEFFQDYLDKGIMSIIQRIRNEASIISEQTKGTPIESIAKKVKEEIQKLQVENPKQLEKNLVNLIFSIRALVPDIDENKLIIDKIDEISECRVVEDKIAMIETVILLIPTLSLNQKLDDIKKDTEYIRGRIDQLLESIDEIRISLEPGVQESIQVTVGASVGGTGTQHVITIPIKSISYYEIEEDIRKYSDKCENIASFPKKLKAKIWDYIRKNPDKLDKQLDD